MSFAFGSDEEQYRSFVVQNWPLFAKPREEEERLIERDKDRWLNFFHIKENQDETKLHSDLYRFLAIASRFKSKRCFKVILQKMVDKLPVKLWNKDLIISILLFYRYAEGMRILYTHEGIKSKRIFHIEDVFENEGFLHTEAADGVSAQANTILGIIAYGRLREDMQEMAKVALDLGAEITKSDEYVRSPLLNAIQSENYNFLALIAELNPAAFSVRVDSTEISDALTFAIDHDKNVLTTWIVNICVDGVVGDLPDRVPARPSSSIEFPVDESRYMSLSALLEGGCLIPGHIVEAKINGYLRIINHFMIYVGNYENKDDAIVHKNGETAFSSDPSGAVGSSSSFSAAQNSAKHNGSIEIGHMTPFEEDGSYSSWRRGAMISGASRGLTDILKLTSNTASRALNTGYGWVNGTPQTRKAPIDIVFDAIENIGACNYDLLRANCEHFANSIARGVVESRQAEKAKKWSRSFGKASVLRLLHRITSFNTSTLL